MAMCYYLDYPAILKKYKLIDSKTVVCVIRYTPQASVNKQKRPRIGTKFAPGCQMLH